MPVIALAVLHGMGFHDGERGVHAGRVVDEKPTSGYDDDNGSHDNDEVALLFVHVGVDDFLIYVFD